MHPSPHLSSLMPLDAFRGPLRPCSPFPVSQERGEETGGWKDKDSSLRSTGHCSPLGHILQTNYLFPQDVSTLENEILIFPIENPIKTQHVRPGGQAPSGRPFK